MTDVWEQLQGRKQPTKKVSIPQDPVAFAAAALELEEAQLALHEGRVSSAVLPPLEERVAAAEKALNDLPAIEFTVSAVPAITWDELVAMHPANAEQRKQGWQWDPSSFRPALLSIALEPKLDEHQWHTVALTGQIGLGELEMLFTEAVQLSNLTPRVAVGKG